MSTKMTFIEALIQNRNGKKVRLKKKCRNESLANFAERVRINTILSKQFNKDKEEE